LSLLFDILIFVSSITKLLILSIRLFSVLMVFAIYFLTLVGLYFLSNLSFNALNFLLR
jgi:hypothetical protein